MVLDGKFLGFDGVVVNAPYNWLSDLVGSYSVFNRLVIIKNYKLYYLLVGLVAS